MKKTVLAWAVVSAWGMGSKDAAAAAFALAEQGASGLGYAYAGAAAVAEDASTVWWNPAGMARLGSGKHVANAGFLIVPNTRFSDTGSTVGARANSAQRGSGGNAGDIAFIPNLFFAMDLNPRWNFGLGVSVPFGLKTEYEPNWIGRFQGIMSEVKTLNINPSVSYKISDAASVGFGVSYQRGVINMLSGVDYATVAAGFVAAGAGAGLLAAVPVGTEGQNRVKLEGDAWGFNVGGLFNVTSGTRVGVHYRSALKYKMDGRTSFSDVPAALSAVSPARFAAGNVHLHLKTPDTAALSVAHTLDRNWEVLADLTWTHWARIKQLPITRDTGAVLGSPLVFNFKDTLRASVGAKYRLNSAWTLKAGVAFDESPVPNAADRAVRLPDSDRYWLSFGAKYQVSRNGALDVGYTFIKVRDADIANNQTASAGGNIVGRYEARVQLFGIQYQHTF